MHRAVKVKEWAMLYDCLSLTLLLPLTTLHIGFKACKQEQTALLYVLKDISMSQAFQMNQVNSFDVSIENRFKNYKYYLFYFKLIFFLLKYLY